MARQSYAELLKAHKQLEAKFQELQRAMQATERNIVGYGVDRWVSVPLPEVQYQAIREVMQDKVCDISRAGKLLAEEDGMQIWQDIVHADDFRGGRPLAEFAAYLVKYSYTQDEGSELIKVWGLLPV